LTLNSETLLDTMPSPVLRSMWTLWTLFVFLNCFIAITLQELPKLEALKLTDQKIKDSFEGKEGKGLTLFDDPYNGPLKLSGAPCKTSNTIPSVEDLMFYNNLAGSMYCGNELEAMNCTLCKNYNTQVTYHKIFDNSTKQTRAMVAVLKERKTVAVVFRGTKTAMNWAADLTYELVDLTPTIRLTKDFMRLACPSIQE